MKAFMFKILISLFVISFIPSTAFSKTLYIQSLDEARNYILEKNYNKAAKAYLSLAKNRTISTDLRANALLLHSLTLWKKQNNIKKAVIALNQILNDFSNTDCAGDALYFLGIIEKERADYEKSKKYLLLFIEKYPNHPRNRNSKNILEKLNFICKTDDLKIRVFLKKTSNPILTSDGGLYFHDVKIKDKKIDAKLSSFGTIVLNSFDTKKKSILIKSKDNIIGFDSKRYHGDIALYSQDNLLKIINIVDLKSYLESVVPSEMPGKWPIEALKTQAVISRSYALHMIEKNINSNHHLEAGTFSQVYKGLNSVCKSSIEAVKETQSQFLTYKNHTILAAFHANSGGITEDPYYPWKEKYNYLSSFKDIYSPPHEWSVKLSLNQLSKKVFNNRYKIKDISIIKRTPSGRVFNIEFDTNIGEIIVKGKQFREKTGIFFVKSTLFNIKKYRNTVLIKGRGFGHGVGLSQWGAKVMAEKGFKYRDIIRFYYSDKIEIDTKLPRYLKDGFRARNLNNLV